MNDEQLLRLYIQYQVASNCTPGTVSERSIALRALLRRSGQTFQTMTKFDLIADLARDKVDGTPLAPKTKQVMKSLFHTFFSWLQEEGFRTDNPAWKLPRVRVPHEEPNPLTTEQIEHLLANGIYAKTRLYVLLYAFQGFRAIEIAAVSGETIDWDRRRILSKDGKGGKEVWRPIHPTVWDELQKYPRTGHLFPSPSGGHVTRGNVSNVLSKALKRAGIIGHRPHQLRAWHATEMIDAGAETIVVAASLRHSDLQSIGKYARIRDQRIADAMDLLPTIHVPDRSGRKRAA